MNWFFNLFRCKVCAEKNERIAEYKAQIEYLKNLTIPNNNPALPPLLTLEADNVMSGSQAITDVSKDQLDEFEKYLKEKQDEVSEANSLLAGTY